ncbi:MAG: hypothetical protein EOO65_00625 [Methanosarcinales archaeon]|nr:MAG: hypothetical protein EOO65_00625 [Methanosarcinales archaeon]
MGCTRACVQDNIYFNEAARDIQRVLRGHLARQLARRRRLERVSTRLQAWWRGCLGRARADRLFLDNTVRSATMFPAPAARLQLTKAVV